MKELAETSLPGMSSLAEESHLAGMVKKRQPILVVLGNPPYSGHSSNVGEWISQEIKAYFKVDGKPLGEKNPKWLQDDYVKFIRFSQWKIDQAGEGLIGIITNHSYLDNPTFRGMRRSLMGTFNEIYILDLHGNSLKKETCPDGSKDENVFDIRQGVSIAFFVKRKNDKAPCNVLYAESWGMRENKYAWLEKHDFTSTKWKKITPKSEFYFFIPRDERLLKAYEKFVKITEIFPANSVGVVSSRDDFVVCFDKSTLERRIGMFKDKKLPDEIISRTFGLKDKKNWKLSVARENIRNDMNYGDAFTKILYRPFDERWIFYHDEVVERSRKEIMRHILRGDNLSICFMRQVSLDEDYTHFLITHHIVDGRTFLSSKGIIQQAPLYLYPDKSKTRIKNRMITLALFESQSEYSSRVPNIDKKLYKVLDSIYRLEPAPEQILYYVYGILYSETYRTKYAEFLKTDFPRIPFTNNFTLFEKMANFGLQLAGLHLFESDDLDKPVAKFQGKGNNKAEKLKYDENRMHVYINEEQYFENVEPDVWKYQIGGYQVCRKWLKDCKDRTLTLEEIKHYCRIVTALEKTIAIQAEIDDIYPSIEKDVIIFY